MDKQTHTAAEFQPVRAEAGRRCNGCPECPARGIAAQRAKTQISENKPGGALPHQPSK
jgi:hypothetical protein